MDVSTFTYELPRRLIAQAPARPRDSSRLMVVDEGVSHLVFREIAGILRPGDVLVLNDTKVVPARLHGRKDTGGHLEFLFVRERHGLWEAMVRGRVRVGVTGEVADRHFEIADRRGDLWLVRTEPPLDGEAFATWGETPVPPYIRRRTRRDEYQTVYARVPGSVAAPTAGMHFTRELIGRLERGGVAIRGVTLHIGPGTFLPVRTERVEDHEMAPEAYEIDGATMDAIEGADRLVCVGTSTVRALESAFRTGSLTGMADVFIYPGYRFRAPMDMFLTNLHLPCSTPLLMVAAFAGWERVRRAYEIAVRERYRFYSFGDAMLLTPRD